LENQETETVDFRLSENGTIVVLCDNASNTLSFANQFIAQEYAVVHTENVEDLYQTVVDNSAEVVVADLSMTGAHIVGEPEFLKLNSILDFDVSTVFISQQTDMMARLAAVRAGGVSFVVAPFEDHELMDSIDRLLDVGLSAPFRVLIVDRDDDFIAFASKVLTEAGMICEVVTDPIQALDALASFVPETILMDISMPGCTGQELASVILQQETFVGTPIIFMSKERRREGRIDVVRHGSYSYMAKPVDIEKLVGVIQGQATRFRGLRSRMVKDSLTGLNNQSMTRRLLEREIDNARRTKLPLTFAMIDIDHFKKVNDTYGHSTGDQVLRSLSRLLKQRFRSNDVIGRLGGEEFGVVIAGTAGTTSKNICDQVREAFSEIEFNAGTDVFTCKFSVGLAEFPACETTFEIMEAADKALYVAKNNGRNQVVLSSE
jgi:diguanylate cyclase (GGDEF)-like protein